MTSFSTRALARRWFRRMLIGAMESYPPERLSSPALVFSPHFDDEVLGCGGLILKKKAAGAKVGLVFMTDGSKSHRHLMPEPELSVRRRGEALAASKALGLAPEEVWFLGFEETRLADHCGAAAAKVAQILRLWAPAEVFIPYRKDGLPDHVAANAIVRSALRTSGRPTIAYEYPIWFWCCWPWVRLPWAGDVGRLRSAGAAAGTVLRWLSDFRCRLWVGDVLGRKREALRQYQSQMTRLVADPRWKTLPDVSDGQFLECFFHGHEVFRRYAVAGNWGRSFLPGRGGLFRQVGEVRR